MQLLCSSSLQVLHAFHQGASHIPDSGMGQQQAEGVCGCTWHICRDGCMGVRVITLHPITSRGVYLQGWLYGGGDYHTHLMKSFLHPRGTTGADTSKGPVLVTLCQSVKLKLLHNHIPTALWSSEEQIQLLSWGPRSCLGANMNSFNFISLSQKLAEHDQSMSGQCRL